MQVLAVDAIWKIAETAKEAVQEKSGWIQYSARTAAEVAVDVAANFTTDDPTEEDRALLMRNAVEMAAERLSDLVGGLAEDFIEQEYTAFPVSQHDDMLDELHLHWPQTDLQRAQRQANRKRKPAHARIWRSRGSAG